MARRAPAQERSIASMNRMLDAGEQLFFEGGNPSLTLKEPLIIRGFAAWVASGHA